MNNPSQTTLRSYSCHILRKTTWQYQSSLLFICCVLVWTWLLACRRERHTSHISDTSPILFNPFSIAHLPVSWGIDIRARAIDSIPTCLRAIKLSARIYSSWAERKAKKLSPPAHVRGQRVKKGSDIEARAWRKMLESK